MSSSDFVPKTDVRHLIKVKKSQNPKIDHPHARYNKLGRISCIVCGIQIKSEHAWNAHILSKTHKQNEAREQFTTLKRPHVDHCNVSNTSKLPRTTSSAPLPDDHVPSKPPNSDLSEISASSEVSKNVDRISTEKTADSLPESKLPEGFFDDKYKDAKVRNVPYKDKLTEEVELFQKELVALEKQSEEILEKESEAMVSRRELDEIDTQLHKWQRIQELEREKESLEEKIKTKLNPIDFPKSEGPLTRIKHETTLSSDTSDEDDLYDFRMKNAI